MFQRKRPRPEATMLRLGPHDPSTKVVVVLLLLASACGTTPQWTSGYPGPFSPCGAAVESDNLVRATIVSWQPPVKRATHLTASPVWYTPLELEVTQSRWGTLSGSVVTNFPAPIEALGLSSKPVDAWILLRRTSERDTAEPFFWTGRAGVVLIKHDGALDTVRGHWSDEAAFLAEMDAAHADPECAFDPNLVLGVSTDATPDAQFVPNNPGPDGGP